eukprot:TRINITY_DN32976_c0_g1_i1.p1 TRINITY_DN32976_c0_g1~~TRINITY_DN32976_c0_g1_i1.p1  ORF type:complete len:507 (-),score=94.73 TRINITY_DN32976_c0_g1_i1:108-1628(-)
MAAPSLLRRSRREPAVVSPCLPSPVSSPPVSPRLGKGGVVGHIDESSAGTCTLFSKSKDDEGFLRGYFTATQKRLGTETHRTRGDHYEFFARLPSSAANNEKDNLQRLATKRSRHFGWRVSSGLSGDVRGGSPTSGGSPAAALLPRVDQGGGGGKSGFEFASPSSQRQKQRRNRRSADRLVDSPVFGRGDPESFDFEDFCAIDEDGKLQLSAPGSPTSPRDGSSRSRGKDTSFVTGDPKSNPYSKSATADLKAEISRREACESLRFLVYKEKGPHDKQGHIFDQTIGTREDVWKLQSVWSDIDEDGSGDIEIQEFLRYFSRTKADRLLGMRCVKYLMSQNVRDHGVRIEDVLRLMWLKAQDEELLQMRAWFREAEFQMDRVATPPILSKHKKRQILMNFPKITEMGILSYNDLLESGFVDGALCQELRGTYDKDNTNKIDTDTLLEIMCPHGYRAHGSATQASDQAGHPIVFVSNEFCKGWIKADGTAIQSATREQVLPPLRTATS